MRKNYDFLDVIGNWLFTNKNSWVDFKENIICIDNEQYEIESIYQIFKNDSREDDDVFIYLINFYYLKDKKNKNSLEEFVIRIYNRK